MEQQFAALSRSDAGYDPALDSHHAPHLLVSGGNGIANHHILRIAIAVLIATSGYCAAGEVPAPAGSRASQPVINCTCRYKGQDFHLGEIVCLPTSKGPRMAQCEMALNNTSWTITEGPCPTASAPAPTTSVFAAADPIAD